MVSLPMPLLDFSTLALPVKLTVPATDVDGELTIDGEEHLATSRHVSGGHPADQDTGLVAAGT
jgi:hypothetical protein